MSNMTERERIAQLEAAVASLQEEVAAWREYAASTAGDAEEQVLRARRAIMRLRPPGAWGERCPPSVVRLLLHFMANPGRLVSRDTIYSLVVRDEAGDTVQKIVDVRICHVRDVAQWCGLPRSAIQTVWGAGYVMAPEAAATIAERLRDGNEAVAA